MVTAPFYTLKQILKTKAGQWAGLLSVSLGANLTVVASAAKESVSPYIHPELSIADIAAGYEGSLARAVWPETSLFLPFEWQIGLSILFFIVMVVTSIVFKRARKWVMLLTTIVIFRHLMWRTFDTLTFAEMPNAIVGYIIYGAEIIAFLTLILGYFQMFSLTNRQAEPLEDFDESEFPAVDVMVCTYNEPLNVLYRTMVGCNYLDYPNKTIYLLDDGNRSEMAQLAKHLNIEYIARKKNKHAKAGNLNNAMDFATGELVMVLDADHVPCRNFLTETVGFFLKEKKLGFVQTPQHFFTQDPFQRNLASSQAVNNEQDLFFHIIEAGNDYHQAAFFGGSGAMFRREALEDIDRFATETITEDVHTGLRLHSAGWKSYYYNKDLSAGMAQDSFADFIKQRIRWSRGMTQVLFNDHPLFVKGLSLAQRLCYFAGIWYFFHGWARIIFMLAPLAFLFFGLKPIDAGFLEIMVYYLPSFTCLVLGYSIITLGMRQSFWSEVYETAVAFYMVRTNLLTMIFPFDAKFKVTPKLGVNKALAFNWQVVLPQLIVGVLLILGMALAVGRALYLPEYWGGIITNAFWTVYNLVLIMGAVFVAQERPQLRLSPRINRVVRCEVRLLDGSIAVGNTTDISESGLGAVFDGPFPITGTLSVKLLDWDIDQVSVFQVQAMRSNIDEETSRFSVGFRCVNRSSEQHASLIRHMFSHDATWRKIHHEIQPLPSLWTLITTPFRLANRKEQALRRRHIRIPANIPMTLVLNGDEYMAMTEQVSETGLAFLLEGGYQSIVGQQANIVLEWPTGEKQLLPVTIRRNVAAQPGHRLIGVEFADLSADEQQLLLARLYPSQNSLVRVAPTEVRLASCIVRRELDEVSYDGQTQELSEMGAVINLALGGLRPLEKEERLTLSIALHKNNDPLEYMATVQQSAAPEGNNQLILVYFEHLNLKSVDQLSEKLYQPEVVAPFETA